MLINALIVNLYMIQESKNKIVYFIPYFFLDASKGIAKNVTPYKVIPYKTPEEKSKIALGILREIQNFNSVKKDTEILNYSKIFFFLKYLTKIEIYQSFKEWVAVILDTISDLRTSLFYDRVYLLCMLKVYFILKPKTKILQQNFKNLISKSIDIIIDRKKIEIKNLDELGLFDTFKKLGLFDTFKKVFKDLIILMFLILIFHLILYYFIPLIMLIMLIMAAVVQESYEPLKAIFITPIIDFFIDIFRLSMKVDLNCMKLFIESFLQDCFTVSDTYLNIGLQIISFLLICFIRQFDIILLLDNVIDLTLEIDAIITKEIYLDKLKLYNDFKKMFKNLIFLMLLLFISHLILRCFIPLILVSVVRFFGCYDAFVILDNFLWSIVTI